MSEAKKIKFKLLAKLFLSMLYISTFTFGGGFVIISLMKKKFVDEYKWLSEQEMLDITSIAQSSPGAIAVNAAVLTGKKIGGNAGIAAAVLGTVIPPVAIISVISFFYNEFSSNRYVALILKGMQAGVAAVILDVACSMSAKYIKQKNLFEAAIIVLSFVLVFFLKLNAAIIILAVACVGTILYLYGRKAVKK